MGGRLLPETEGFIGRSHRTPLDDSFLPYSCPGMRAGPQLCGWENPPGNLLKEVAVSHSDWPGP